MSQGLLDKPISELSDELWTRRERLELDRRIYLGNGETMIRAEIVDES